MAAYQARLNQGYPSKVESYALSLQTCEDDNTFIPAEIDYAGRYYKAHGNLDAALTGAGLTMIQAGTLLQLCWRRVVAVFPQLIDAIPGITESFKVNIDATESTTINGIPDQLVLALVHFQKGYSLLDCCYHSEMSKFKMRDMLLRYQEPAKKHFENIFDQIMEETGATHRPMTKDQIIGGIRSR